MTPLYQIKSSSELHGPRYQRGAAAVMVGLMSIFLIALLGFTIDAGRMYFAQRDLQLMANLAAADAARVVGGCQGELLNPQTAAFAAALTSVQANGGLDSYLTSGSVDVGVITSSGGLRSLDSSSSERPTAAQVNLVRPLPTYILPLITGGSTPGGNLRASSVATNLPETALQVRSQLASVTPTDSDVQVLSDFFTPVFGGPVSLSVLDAETLVNTRISLQDIATELGVGGTEGLLNAEDVGAPDLLGAIAEAAAGVNPAAADIINAIAAVAANIPLDGLDLLGIGDEGGGGDDPDPVTGNEVLLGVVEINASEILTNLASAAIGSASIQIPLGINIPGVASVNADIGIIDPPKKTDFGRPVLTAHTAQIGINLALDVPLQLVLPGIAGLNTNVNVDLFVRVADAQGSITGLNCANVSNTSHTVSLEAQTSTAQLGIGRFSGLDTSSPVLESADPLLDAQLQFSGPVALALTLLGLPSELGVEATLAGGPVDVGSGNVVTTDMPGPFVPQITQPSEENKLRIGNLPGESITNALGDLRSTLSVQGPVITANGVAITPDALPVVLNTLDTLILAQLNTVLDTVLADLDTLLLGPLLGALGADIGSAEFTILAMDVNADLRDQENRSYSYIDFVTH